MEKTPDFDYTKVPNGYVHCFHHDCPRASECLRHLTGLNICIDCANGAAAAAAQKLFPRLGAKCTFLGVTPDGKNINDGVGSTHLEKIEKEVVAGGYDCGIAFDGDADRCLACDEKGQEIDGDKIIALLSMQMQREGVLDANTAVVTVGMLNSGTRFNVISGYAKLIGTTRCFKPEIRARFPEQLERIAKETARAMNGDAKLTYNALIPPTFNDADMAERVRADLDVPMLVMTYINPVFVYGPDRFLERCRRAGICAIIVPDMPYEQKQDLQPYCTKHGVKLISMIAPTSEDRISMIASEAEGFIYIVSSMGVTGVRTSFSSNLEDMVAAVRRATDIPCAIGFGISTPEQARRMTDFADGAIVGSAIVRIIAEHGRDSVPYVAEYVRNMRAELDRV